MVIFRCRLSWRKYQRLTFENTTSEAGLLCIGQLGHLAPGFTESSALHQRLAPEVEASATEASGLRPDFCEGLVSSWSERSSCHLEQCPISD
jgi:hypothetical protein